MPYCHNTRNDSELLNITVTYYQPILCKTAGDIKRNLLYLNAEHMLATTGFTPLLLNLESTTSKPNAVGGTEDCAEWKVEEAVHDFIHADKVNTDSSTDKTEPIFSTRIITLISYVCNFT